jgi:hypothetical protein
MNKNRRKDIEALVKRIEEAKAKIMITIAEISISDMAEDVTDLHEQEMEYFDNMPESLQSGEKGTSAEEAIGYLDTAKDKLEEIVNSFESLEDDIEEVIDALSNAAGC